MVKVRPALVGRAGELLVAAELLRQGVEVALPAFDHGIDLIAYRLPGGQWPYAKFVPIQVKAASGTNFNFQKTWFMRVTGVVLVHVWNIITIPEFYIFDGVESAEATLGPQHTQTSSWRDKGGYTVTHPGEEHRKRMNQNRDKWSRITDQLKS